MDAHHDDYSKPLRVRWLCRKCHRRYHADEKSSAKMKAELATRTKRGKP
jgi:transposase-like protein